MGNHAQAVAFAANVMGIKAKIIMPVTATVIKEEATKGYGAEVIPFGESFREALNYALTQRDFTFIHAFDDEKIIAGQGTIGIEIIEDLSDIYYVIVPVGGGGLISGIATAIKVLSPKTKVIGVQAEAAPAAFLSLKEKAVCEKTPEATIADGIAIGRPGDIAFEIMKTYVDEIILVTEGSIAMAMLHFLERKKLVVEGAGAVPLAALIMHREVFTGKRIVLVTSGGNVDFTLIDTFKRCCAPGPRKPRPSSARLEEEVLALLPRSDCGACGAHGCLAFARLLLRGQATPAQCLQAPGPVKSQLTELLAQAPGDAAAGDPYYLNEDDCHRLSYLLDPYVQNLRARLCQELSGDSAQKLFPLKLDEVSILQVGKSPDAATFHRYIEDYLGLEAAQTLSPRDRAFLMDHGELRLAAEAKAIEDRYFWLTQESLGGFSIFALAPLDHALQARQGYAGTFFLSDLSPARPDFFVLCPGSVRNRGHRHLVPVPADQRNRDAGR